MLKWLFIFAVVCSGFLIGATAAVEIIQLRREVNILLASEQRIERERQRVDQELKLVKKENLDCVIRSLETLVEAREFVLSVFEERIFIPVDRNVFIALAPIKNKDANGMEVEIEN